jgi:hypothetical protein
MIPVNVAVKISTTTLDGNWLNHFLVFRCPKFRETKSKGDTIMGITTSVRQMGEMIQKRIPTHFVHFVIG